MGKESGSVPSKQELAVGNLTRREKKSCFWNRRMFDRAAGLEKATELICCRAMPYESSLLTGDHSYHMTRVFH